MEMVKMSAREMVGNALEAEDACTGIAYLLMAVSALAKSQGSSLKKIHGVLDQVWERMDSED